MQNNTLSRHAGKLSRIAMYSLFISLAACGKTDEELPPSKLYFANEGYFEVAPGDSMVFRPRITYDVDSRYLWTENGKEVSTEKNYKFVANQMRDFSLHFEVSNNRGSDSSSIHVSVLKHINCSGLLGVKRRAQSGLKLLPDSLAPDFWADETICFHNQVNADTTQWAGFALGSRTTVQTTANNMARGTAHVTNSGSAANDYFALDANTPELPPTISFARAYTPRSIDIANDNFTYLLCRNGGEAIADGDTIIIRPMTSGDYLTMKIEGIDRNGAAVSALEYTLLDYTNGLTSNVFRLDKWATIDLRPLGQVWGLRFRLLCSKSPFTLNACIDNLKLQD